MRIDELGDMTGELLVFGGPYSNLQAMEALLAHSQARNIPPDNMICTGDLVAYGAHPREVVALAQQSGIRSISGNCEQQLASGADDCGCGFEDGSACDLYSAQWYRYAQTQISEAQRHYMADLPNIATFTHYGRKWAVLHGGVREVARFIWPTDDAALFSQELETLRALIGPFEGVLAGHCGVPFMREIDGVSWVNAGVIGMPAHDGVAETCYLTLDAAGPQMHRLTYDYPKAARAMREAGLPAAYAAALECGYWPNEEILPANMRQGRVAAQLG